MTRTALQVIVVGGGIAGLTAAIGIRRAGHHVTVLDRSPSATAFGAAVVICPNGTKVLSALSIDPVACHMSRSTAMRVYKGDTLDEVRAWDNTLSPELYGAAQLFVHRVDFAEGLAGVAGHEEGVGPPVRFVYGAEVVGFDAELGSVRLTDGRVFEGDLVVAADGVHSGAPLAVFGRERPAEVTGTTIIRFMLETAALKGNPLTAPLIEAPGEAHLYIGTDRHRWLLQYPCREDTMQNFGMYSLVEGQRDVDAQTLRFNCDRGSLKRELEGFSERIVGIAGLAGEILPVWKIQERKPLERWWRGRLVMIGLVQFLPFHHGA